MSGFNPEDASEDWPDYTFDESLRPDDNESRVKIPPSVKVAVGGIAVAGLVSAIYVMARKHLHNKGIEE